jgi:hypothetical protein
MRPSAEEGRPPYGEPEPEPPEPEPEHGHSVETHGGARPPDIVQQCMTHGGASSGDEPLPQLQRSLPSAAEYCRWGISLQGLQAFAACHYPLLGGRRLLAARRRLVLARIVYGTSSASASSADRLYRCIAPDCGVAIREAPARDSVKTPGPVPGDCVWVDAEVDGTWGEDNMITYLKLDAAHGGGYVAAVGNAPGDNSGQAAHEFFAPVPTTVCFEAQLVAALAAQAAHKDLTTSDVCNVLIKPATIPAGWRHHPTCVNAEKSWFSHEYEDLKTGTRQTEAPPGTSSMCDVLRDDPTTARHIGRPTVFFSHAWLFRFLDVLAAMEARTSSSTSIREPRFRISRVRHQQHLSVARPACCARRRS